MVLSLHNADLCVCARKSPKENLDSSSTWAPRAAWPWVGYGTSHLLPRTTVRLSSQKWRNFENFNSQVQIIRIQSQLDYYLKNLGQIT